MTNTITLDHLRSALEEGGVTVVDALPAAPFSQRHIPGALNLIHEDTDTKILGLLPDKDAVIVTYSTDVACGRCVVLAERLESLGYTDVSVYRGGIEDWVAVGLPVEIGSAEPA